MKKISIGLFAAALALSGCGGGDKPAGGDASAAASSAPAAGGGTSTGVAECDDYFAKVQSCVDSKVPEAQRAMVRQPIEQAKQQLLQIPDKTALAAACKSATDTAKQTFASYGCTF